MKCSPSFVCAIRLPTGSIELRVSCDCGERAVWNWSVRNGEMLDAGTSDTRDGAQIAAELAFDQRLRRTGLKRYADDPFKWKELIEADSALVRFGTKDLPL